MKGNATPYRNPRGGAVLRVRKRPDRLHRAGEAVAGGLLALLELERKDDTHYVPVSGQSWQLFF